MNCLQKHKLLLFLLLFCQQSVFSQYILNGSAQKNSCNCYTLTQPADFQSGSVWNSNKINLNNSFDFWFNVFLGCNDAGADGIVFILQPISTSVGSSGEGMGFGGVSPSIGIALDTYQNNNLNDPAADHISIQANGIVNHSSDLAGPVPISATSHNVEDCQWHKLRITWDAGTKWLRTYFDGVLRVEKQVDLITTIFNNDPNVYWGFTGATGGAVNLQQFCTALDPIFTTNVSNNIGCEGTPVAFTNSSESFAPIASYHWSFGDGTFSSAANPPPHVFPAPGDYRVTLKVTGQDGCERDSSKTITIAPNPSASLTVFDTCFRKVPRLAFTAPSSGVSHQWTIDGAPFSGSGPPPLSNLSAGNHQLQVVVSSNYGCGQPVTSTADFLIKPLPSVEVNVQDACVNEPVNFEGLQTDTETTILQWQWQVGENQFYNSRNFQHRFSQPDDYKIKLWAKASNGCISDTIESSLRVSRAVIIARDTVIMRNNPAQLHVWSNGDVVWSPSVGLSDPTINNPIATLNSDQQYIITATTAEGCTAETTMLVKVYEGPAVYVPTAFTPNGDGKNEILRPVYVGIKELKQFAVFNRWGQMVFQTKEMNKGWEGKSLPGTYVWIVNAVTDAGKPLFLKGTVTIIR